MCRAMKPDGAARPGCWSQADDPFMVARKVCYKEGSAAAILPPCLVKPKRQRPFLPNEVCTTRFTMWTWLPKSLFLQFQRAANIYFFVVCCLVCAFPEVAMWQTTVFPFAAVIGWTCLKDMYEDMRRKRDDDAENLRACWCYDVAAKKCEAKHWKEVLVGDILVTFQNEALPADVLVVRSEGGQSFISTVNLDGETNLKERRACDLLSAMMEHAGDDAVADPEADPRKHVLDFTAQNAHLIQNQGLCCDFDKPEPLLSILAGQAFLETPSDLIKQTLAEAKVASPCLLHYENFIPRGCVLRNAKWLISIAAYTGDQTKTRLNVSPVQAKVSNMQEYLNRAVQGLVTLLAVFCLYAGFRKLQLRADGEANDDDDFITTFCKSWIVMYQVVPISLYVFFEGLKLLLGARISTDETMRCGRTGKLALARTADLVEEMGQVDFVFSDKTGTLTENEMLFAHCFVAGEESGDFRHAGKTSNCDSCRPAGNPNVALQLSPLNEKPEEKPNNEIVPPGVAFVTQMLAAEKEDDNPARAEFRWFFILLALCHTAQVEMGEGGSPVYTGSSPDEVAFLEAAHRVGVTYELRRRTPGHSGWDVHLAMPREGRLVFTVLCELAFTSERKRMSVIVEHLGEYFCITKGADNVIGKLCEEPFTLQVNEHLSSYSKLGLRTLVFASKVLDGKTVVPWVQRVAAAKAASDFTDRHDRLTVLAREMEHGLMFSGVTAIEDKLQEGVAESISTVRAAGIRFWMLTGDKTETAVEISRACQLFTGEMVLAYMVDTENTNHALYQVAQACKLVEEAPASAGLVLDGAFCQFCFQSQECRKKLYELASSCSSCVACRLSPQQKRRLVEVVRHENKMAISLAIGDGANDVSMIQAAHVGIGIRGKEGNQAVQASDVAISQFRFLVPLLLLHGRRAYRRVSMFLCYVLYKHLVLAMNDGIWAHQNGFQGLISINEWLSGAYPSIFTSFPIVVVLLFDQDLPDSVVLTHPWVYSEGLRRMRFNTKVFLLWVISGLWHGALSWAVPSYLLGSNDYESQEFWIASCTSYIITCTLVSLKLWMMSLNPTSPIVMLVVAWAIVGAIVAVLLFSETQMGYWFSAEEWYLEGVAAAMVQSQKAMAVLFLTPLAMVIDFLVMIILMYAYPYPLDVARRLHAKSAREASNESAGEAGVAD